MTRIIGRKAPQHYEAVIAEACAAGGPFLSEFELAARAAKHDRVFSVLHRIAEPVIGVLRLDGDRSVRAYPNRFERDEILHSFVERGVLQPFANHEAEEFFIPPYVNNQPDIIYRVQPSKQPDALITT